jgi:hypothetical protein
MHIDVAYQSVCTSVFLCHRYRSLAANLRRFGNFANAKLTSLNLNIAYLKQQICRIY